MNGPHFAVVLAGGEGRRMGGSKPTRRLGGTTLIGRALHLARTYAVHVAVAVRDEGQVVGAAGVRLLLDEPSIEGPLAGLASALRFARGQGADRVLTLPCDSPCLPADFAARLRAALGPSVGVAVARSGGRLHPVCALWSTQALDALPAYLASGRRSLNGFAVAVGLTVVDWPVGGVDPFANANTPEELEALQPGRRHVAVGAARASGPGVSRAA
jgi:molybdopterin-guanine dinucleotide biosynthesis protein A